MLMKLFVSALLIGVLCLWKITFSSRPTKRQMRRIEKEKLVHFTSSSMKHDPASKEVCMIPSKGISRNFSTWNRDATYFFVGEPSVWRLATNNVTSFEQKITIDVQELDPDKILYRPEDRVVAYLGTYIGPAEVESFTMPATRRRIVKALKMLSTVWSLIVVLLTIVALDLFFVFVVRMNTIVAMNVVMGLFGVSGISILAIHTYEKLKNLKKSS